MNADFLTPRVYLSFTKERLSYVDKTLKAFLNNRRRRGVADIDEDLWKELLKLETYYNQLTGKKGIQDYRKVLEKKWNSVNVLMFPI